jgi:predicted small secreted protein
MQTRNIPLTVALIALAAALAACETTGSGPGPQAAAPPTRQQAALDCWMATEKDAVKLGLDKRADVVTKCIGEVMAGKQTDSAVADSEGKPKPAAAVNAKPAVTGALPKIAAKPKSSANAKPDAKPDPAKP